MEDNIRINKDVDNSALEELINRRKELIDADKNDETVPVVEQIFMEIMNRAQLVTAINMSQPPKKLSNGEFTLAQGTNISFLMIASQNGDNYLPMFTKRSEMGQWGADNAKNTILMGFDNTSMIVKTNPNCAGIVVNPFTQNFVIPRKFVEDMIERRELIRDGQTNRVLTADTPCELYTPSPYPMEMSNALVETAKGTGAIERLWLRGVKLEDQDGYLLVVDFNGDRDVVFSRLGQAARPFLGELPMHIVAADSGFGENAIKNVVAFYNRS